MREWIVTNGLGGYASLTYQNTNTRKYHGLLVSSLNPPTERWVFISNVYDKLQIEDKTYNFNDAKGVFSFDVFPSFSYDFEGTKIKKTVFMEQEKNTTILKYDIKTKKPVTMVHTPHLNSRHLYDVTSQRHLNFEQETIDNGVVVKPDNVDKKLKIILKNSTYDPAFYWEEFFYEKDKERNDSWVDNNVHLGDLNKTINGDATYYLVLTLEDEINSDPSEIYSKELQRKKDIVKQSNLSKEFEKLVLSTDNFIVKKANGKSIVAGYHWFGDWGRDTLIALPGIALVTKRYSDAKQILFSFSQYCKNGLIPNAFMERDSVAVYNNVDSSLWYIDRVFQYLKYTNDKEFVKKIWGTLESIIDGYKNGTDFDIHMDEDYLISHGPGLTWMDVKIGDYYPTPRNNKAVEIQALWYNALRIMSSLSQILGKKDTYYDLSEKVEESFNNQFDKQYDVIDTKDLSLRPNKIFLVSLDYQMISENIQKKIVDDVRDKLVTVFGLRTLSPEDSRYKGCYIGNYNKDEAYHNGIVWPWLMGPFVKAFLKTKPDGAMWGEFAYTNFLKPMLDIYGENWDGNIYEIFDGDPIYAPHGCITQAWSVSEILRCWVEDVENIRPEYEEIFKSSKIRV
ncbi:MAG: glycogen debranching protein [Thermoplasmata archaeon]|nr:MAG: glycogen debranching protein [Thermoplasmata archaeon]